MARKRKLAAAVFSLGCFHASSLMALGLGELKVESFLNEPLNASVDLLNLDGLNEDQIRVRLATSEDFNRLGVERLYFLTMIKFEVVTGGAGGPRILISSDKPVLEPYLDFIVEARWPDGRLLREYTVLVDPPVYSEQTTVVSASQRVYETEGIPAPEDAQAEGESAEPVGLFPEQPAEGAGSTRVKSSGTRVDVRDSNLAPGAMPQRDFNAEAATAPTAGSRYMIGRDDTLWEIANRARPAGTSVHQEMLDIQRLNPDAFINGNINLIKAGYIIYLPTADDISSVNEPAALAEVREQNAAWREGRDAELYASRGGPSLRISADEPDTETGAVGDDAVSDALGVDVGGEDGTALGAETLADVERMELPADADAAAQLAAAQDQVEALKRIVDLKNDQIATLQGALEDAGVEADELVEEAGADPAEDPGLVEAIEETAGEEVSGEALVEVEGLGESVDALAGEALDDDPLAPVDEFGESAGQMTDGESEEFSGELSEEVVEEVVEEVEEPVVAVEPVQVEEKAEPAEESSPKPSAPAADSGSWTDNLMYIAGAIIAGLLALFVLRRRREEDDEDVAIAETGAAADAFSGVELKEQDVDPDAVADEPLEEPVEQQAPARDNRGYGERKHDEYASDVDASDALAEADIYIAYGRHPQAIDLLNNALEIEPNNPIYRLKLLEIYKELDDRGAAAAQLEQIHASGNQDMIDRAEALMSGDSGAAATPEPSPAAAPASGDPGLSPNPLMPEGDESLESDFSGLEIEEPAAETTSELDLSEDFAGGDAPASDDEELVIADDSNGLSTKLDLARAYLDMGDDDGARQILDEVVAEGSPELKSEAQTLLDRIGG